MRTAIFATGAREIPLDLIAATRLEARRSARRLLARGLADQAIRESLIDRFRREVPGEGIQECEHEAVLAEAAQAIDEVLGHETPRRARIVREGPPALRH